MSEGPSVGKGRSVGNKEKTGPQRARSPRWARLCAIFGALLMVLSGGTLVTSEVLVARYAGSVKTQDLFGGAAAAGAEKEPVSDIRGPVNILLVGIDPRDATTLPLADSIIVIHVPSSMKEAYVFSVPRDLYVDIPAYPPSGFLGTSSKINAAMSFGSKLPNGKHDANQGFGLLAKTVSQVTGIKRFDAGAILNFNGFKKIVDAMGGVTMMVDERTKSEHLRPDGKPRPRDAYCHCDHPYRGPYKVYEKGIHHLQGWEALDFVRQRYGLKGTDYARQRHQQQFLKAMAAQAFSKDVVTNPATLDRVMRAAGDALIFDGKGHNVVDWALALKGIRADSITTVKLPGGGLGTGRGYKGEALEPVADGFFAAVRSDTVGAFMTGHTELVNRVN